MKSRVWIGLFLWPILAVFPSVSLAVAAAGTATETGEATDADLRLWYDEPADAWTEALPIGKTATIGRVRIGERTHGLVLQPGESRVIQN